MEKGFSVAVGMSLAYAVSFFGLLLAYIVYQRNHHPDELWRRRPVGVSFFSALYGYILPLLVAANALLTLIIKVFKGWDFNSFVWSNQALVWPLPAGVLLFWLVGRLFWKMKPGGYASALAVALAATAGLSYLVAEGLSPGSEAGLHRLGAYVSGLIWHISWLVYFLRGKVRGLFLRRESPA